MANSDTATMPDEWVSVRLGDIACLRRGTVKAIEDESIPYIALENIESNGMLKGWGNACDSASPKTVFKNGDTLYGKLRPNLKKVVRVHADGVCSTDILAIFGKEYIDDSFLSHLLRSGPFHGHAMQGITGTRMPRTSWKHLQTFKLLLPPLSEQRIIASVLDSIDEVIESTEITIATIKSLHDALAHQLLTRGVPGWHTEWKIVKGIGAIPSGWKLCDFKDVAEVSFSPVDKKSVAGEIPVRLCNYTDVFYSSYIHSGMNFMNATAKSNECTKWRLCEGDVLFTKDSETPREIGIPAYVIEDMSDVLCGYHLGLARPRPDYIRGKFLTIVLASVESKRQLACIANGVTRFGLTLQSVRSIKIPLPPLEEQDIIAATLDSFRELIEYTTKQLDALKNLKLAISDSLLTGRVRLRCHSG